MFQNSSFSFKDTHPIQQGLFCVALVTLISLFCLLFRIRSMQAWNVILSPVFLFCSYNPIIGIFRQKLFQYTAISILVLIGLSFYIYVAGNLVSDFSFKQSNELHLIAALAFVFYFLLFTISIVFRAVLYLLNEVDK